MLTATLASLWAGALVAPSAGTPANQAAPSPIQLGIEPGALPSTLTAVVSPVAVPESDPRSIPLLVGLLATLVAGGAWWLRAPGPGARPRRIWQRPWLAQLPTRAPPHRSA
jgi:hypothetical protein